MPCIGGQPGSPSCLLIGQVARSGSSAKVRPLSNWSLPRACSRGRTRSECSGSEIAGLSYRDAPSRRLSFPLHLPLPPEQQPPGSPAGLFIPKQQQWLIVRDPFPTPRWLGSLASQTGVLHIWTHELVVGPRLPARPGEVMQS